LCIEFLTKEADVIEQYTGKKKESRKKKIHAMARMV
jgi:hypothetical protein